LEISDEELAIHTVGLAGIIEPELKALGEVAAPCSDWAGQRQVDGDPNRAIGG